MNTIMKGLWLLIVSMAAAWVTTGCSQEATEQKVQEVAKQEAPKQAVQVEPELPAAIHLDISAAEFQGKIAEKAGLILDVRTPDEVAQGTIEGATVIDFYGDQFQDEIAKLDKNQTVYVYCRSGGRSGKTMNQLKELGFANVYNLAGGITAWKAAGLPLALPTATE